MSEQISRRYFLSGVAAAAAGVAAAATGCTPQEKKGDEGTTEPAPTPAPAPAPTPTPSDEMSDDEAIAFLNAEPEILSDLVLDDGTVIPAVYVRVRNRINRVGVGSGTPVGTGNNFWAFAMRIMNEEEAEYYLDMPLTKTFTATEFAVKSGRDEAKCLEICEALSSRGILYRVRRGGTAHFRLIPMINGIWEYSINLWGMEKEEPEYLGMMWGSFGPNVAESVFDSDIPPYFRSLPVSAEVIGDERVMSPYDDFEAIIRRSSVIARGDCPCRANKRILGDSSDTHPTQTEILTGEQAEYYIENGIGWPISQEEALEVLHDAVDKGLVIQTTHSKAGEIFCCCAGDCCRMLNAIKAGATGAPAMKYYSHYNLRHEKDDCIKCGMCVTRCHLDAITMDEDGYPTTGDSCVRCGQCAVTCPVAARKLFLIEDFPELPDTLVDTDLHKAITRVKRGHVIDFVPGA